VSPPCWQRKGAATVSAERRNAILLHCHDCSRLRFATRKQDRKQEKKNENQVVRRWQGRARHRQGPQPAAGGPGPLRWRRGRRLPVHARGPGARMQPASITRTCALAPAVLHADVYPRCCCLRSAMACSGGGWGTTEGGDSGPADRACVRLQEALHANTTGLPYPYDSCGIRGLEYDRCHLISCLPQTGRPEASLHTAHQDRDL